ncbi:glycoside hydrolase family 18 protein [Streptomyces sp. NPDC049906]|uniref:chitinase n=1 Tax=Streptomyces sp. NPDC049906 TaxID=3155656 RepID=UPI003429AA78
MERTRRHVRPPARGVRARLLAVLAATALAVLPGLTATATAAPAVDADLVRNGGFEAGLDGWTCSAGSGAAVTTPVRTGTSALRATPSGGDHARCSQSVTVKPDAQYTLTGHVRGTYTYLGVTGTGTSDGYDWTQSAADWKRLSTTFRTGPTTTRVTLYAHGWYGTPAYHVDDVTLVGPAVDPGQPPVKPTGLRTDSVGPHNATVAWDPVPGATGYTVQVDGARAWTGSATSAYLAGLSPGKQYRVEVAATNDAGTSPLSAVLLVTTPLGEGDPLPPKALVGYLHASFANGSGYTRMADVPNSWDVIHLAFGEPTSVTSGDIRFTRCPVTECPNVESEAEFKAAIKAKQAQGKKVLISIGGQNGQVQLSSTGARDAFVTSVSKIVDEYGLDGLDIDFEGHSLSLNANDTDFKNPTTPVIVNLIQAVKTLKATYGPRFMLTMAPETFFVQLGYQYYGTGRWGGQDPRAGAYLPVIHALRNDLTLLHVQDYNSGSIMGLDNQYHSMGGADFHIAMTDMLLTGFPVAGDATNVFPALRPEQVAIGMPASTNAGNGHVSGTEVNKALDCLTKGTGCGTYRTHGVWPALRGLMSWSINWDRHNNTEFSRNFDTWRR